MSPRRPPMSLPLIALAISALFTVLVLSPGVSAGPGGGGGPSSPSLFWGVDGHMVQTTRDFLYLGLMEEAGCSSYGIEFIHWGTVVPDEDTARLGPGEYSWDWPDFHVSYIDEVNGQALIKIWCKAAWATEEDPTLPQYLWPPKDGPEGDPELYWDFWGEFCQALVERYDGDGIDDMGADTPDPSDDLVHPVLHYQIQGETEWRWQSTPADYVKLLEIANQSMKAACEDVQVLYSSFNFGDYFDDNPSLDETLAVFEQSGRPEIDFVETMLAFPQLFDIAPTQMNHDYTGIPARLRWLRYVMEDVNGYERPVWFPDAASGYMLNSHPNGGVEPNPHYDVDHLPAALINMLQASYSGSYGPNVEAVIVDVLQQGDDVISLEGYQFVKAWWEGDKAAFALKKSAISAGLGVERIYSQWIIENSQNPCIDLSGWATCGLLDDNDPVEEFEQGKPRPVYYTMEIFNEMVGGFDTAKVILPGGPKVLDTLGPLWYETWLIEFKLGGKKVYVAWDDGADTGGQNVNLSKYLRPAEAVQAGYIVTQLNDEGVPIHPEGNTFPTKSVLLTRQPVFLVPLSDKPGDDLRVGEASSLKCMPNPSRGSVTIEVSFAPSVRRENSSVRIYNLAGRLVRELQIAKGDGPEAAVFWDGLDSRGGRAPSGVYFYQLSAGGVTAQGRKLVILR